MHHFRIIRILLPLAIIVGAGCLLLLRGKEEQDLPIPPPPPYATDLNHSIVNGMSDIPALRPMDHAIDSFMNFWSLHGTSLAIVRHDSLVYAKGYGMADTYTPVSPGTTFRLASVSKLLTAVGIMRLQEEGRVFLETPVFGPMGILNEYDGYIRDENYYLITVEHLLRHQGGFSNRGGDVMFNTLTFLRNYGLSKVPSASLLVQKQLGRALAFEPGTYQEYSNFGYLLLSLVIEKVSGLSYEEYMQQEVFAPALCEGFLIAGNYLKDRHPGETQYFMQPDSELCPSFDGRYGAVEKCYGGNYISGLLGAGAWIGSSVELARLVACIDGESYLEDLLDEFSIRQMTHYVDDDTYALGWVDCNERGIWTRSGSFSGTSALVKAYPDGEIWILLSNTSAWRGSRFSKDISALFTQLRSRFSPRLPRQDLFREQP